MVKTSDFESENSGSSPGEAAIKIVTQALVEAFPFGPECARDECTCAGFEKWDCILGATPDQIANIVVSALAPHPRCP